MDDAFDPLLPIGVSPRDDPSSVFAVEGIPRGGPGPPQGPLGLSRDTWAKLVIWFIPIIFASGTLFYSFQNMDSRVDKNADNIQRFSDRQQSMSTKQSVQANTLDSIEEVQGELKARIETVNDKLDSQKGDLISIKTKLKIREPRSRDN